MRGGFAPRFGIEAGFLILLGVGAGIADLRTVVIVAVLAAGWLLVSLIELVVWRSQGRVVAAPYVPPSPRDADTEPGWPAEPEAAEPEVAYPLRADAGSEPSEEIEAYTRVLGSDRDAEPEVEGGPGE